MAVGAVILDFRKKEKKATRNKDHRAAFRVRKPAVARPSRGPGMREGTEECRGGDGTAGDPAEKRSELNFKVGKLRGARDLPSDEAGR